VLHAQVPEAERRQSSVQAPPLGRHSTATPFAATPVPASVAVTVSVTTPLTDAPPGWVRFRAGAVPSTRRLARTAARS
jgi:hypothetical protein